MGAGCSGEESTEESPERGGRLLQRYMVRLRWVGSQPLRSVGFQPLLIISRSGMYVMSLPESRNEKNSENCTCRLAVEETTPHWRIGRLLAMSTSPRVRTTEL